MSPTRCKCVLRDCHYYAAVPDDAEACDCGHEEKHYYMSNPCPLYKKAFPHDAMKKMTERFLRKPRGR